MPKPSTTEAHGVKTKRLLYNNKDIAPLEVADTAAARTKGLLGRDGIEGAILLEHTRGIHTFRMRFPIDVAFCDRDRQVIKIKTMPPGRLVFLVRRARSVIECEAGMLAHWGIQAGGQIEIVDPTLTA